MNPQIHAALIMHDFFVDDLKLEYAIIGGIALQFWGEPRFTLNVETTVQDRLDIDDLVKVTTEDFGSRVSDPYQFAKATRMILLNVENVDVDVAIALRSYEEFLFERSQSYEVEPGRELIICSAEDLIIHKALAGRPQDLLEVRYIRSWLTDFSKALADDSILDRFEQAWAKK
jgi:hypothetical protein